MANKVVITADRTCDLNKPLLEEYNVHDLPLHIVIGGKSYSDWEDITPEQLYDIYYKTKELPKTTALSVGEYEDVFKKYVDEGFDVVHLSLGSALSATSRSAVLAAESFPGRVYVVDTQSLSTGCGLLVIKACELRDQGVEASEIAKRVSAMTSKSHASFVLERLDFMASGGRCSNAAKIGANLLKLRPEIEVNNTAGGSMDVGKKYRGEYGSCLLKYTDDVLSKYDNIDTDRVFITHAGADEEYVQKVKAELEKRNIFKKIYITRASCVISSHCGPNTLGVLFMTK